MNDQVVHMGDVLVMYVFSGGDEPTSWATPERWDVVFVSDPLIRDFHRAGIFLPGELEAVGPPIGEDPNAGVSE